MCVRFIHGIKKYHTVFKGYGKTDKRFHMQFATLFKKRCVDICALPLQSPTHPHSLLSYRPNLGTALCNLGIILLIYSTHLFALLVCLKKCCVLCQINWLHGMPRKAKVPNPLSLWCGSFLSKGRCVTFVHCPYEAQRILIHFFLLGQILAPHYAMLG